MKETLSAEHNISDLGFSSEIVGSTHLDATVPGDQHIQCHQFDFSQNVDVAQSSGGGKAEAPSKLIAQRERSMESCANDYVKRRNKNNIAVKKSREKSKQKGATTAENIEKLKVENVQLEEKVEVLNKELSVLKKAFLDNARGFSGIGGDLPDLGELEKLLGHKLIDKPATSLNLEDHSSSSNLGQ